MLHDLVTAYALTKSSLKDVLWARWLLALLMALALALPVASHSRAEELTFTALEVSIQFPLDIAPPLAGGSAHADTTEVPVGLPAGSIALFVVLGVVSAVDTSKGEWHIGSQHVLVYESAATKFGGNRKAGVGDVVKVVAMRALAPGPVVAEKITLTQPGPQNVTPATVEVAFLFNGQVKRVGTSVWHISEVDFNVSGAVIDQGLGVGSAVTVEFAAAAAASPAQQPPAGGQPPAADQPPADELTFTGLEIFAQVPLDIPPTLSSSPKADTTAVPTNLPPGTIALFVVDGVVTLVGSNGEWQIGSPPVFVYTSAETKLINNPVAGDHVKVVALRTLAPGPIVAERITRRQVGPLPLGVATVEAAFLFNGTVGRAAADMWHVGEVNFIVNDPNFPAAIDAGLGVGSAVTVEFGIAAGAAPAPQSVPPPPQPPVERPNPPTAGGGTTQAPAGGPSTPPPTGGSSIPSLPQATSPAPAAAPLPPPNLPPPPAGGSQLEVSGTVRSVQGNVWTVGPFVVTVDPNTQMLGATELGSNVEVWVNVMPDGQVVAVVVRGPGAPPAAPAPTAPAPAEAASPPGSGAPAPASAEQPPAVAPAPAGIRVQISGEVRLIQGNVWTVGSFVVTVGSSTQLVGNPAPGSQVTVEVLVQPDGTVVTSSITATG